MVGKYLSNTVQFLSGAETPVSGAHERSEKRHLPTMRRAYATKTHKGIIHQPVSEIRSAPCTRAHGLTAVCARIPCIYTYIYIYTRVYLSRPVLLRSVRRVLA